MNRHHLLHTLHVLDDFMETSLGLQNRKRALPPALLNQCLLSACAYNTHVETVCNKADSLFRYIQDSDCANFTFSYLRFLNHVARKISLPKKNVVLGFDYTKETFWGDVQGIHIQGSPASEKGTGAFHFLTCSQVSGKLHAKIPLVSIPVHLGHNKAHAVTHCLSLLDGLIGPIELSLFDRGFYSKDLMMSLNHLDVPYLIFVPKRKGEIQNTLHRLYPGETTTQVYPFEVNKHKTVYRDQATMAFLKAIFDGRSYKHYDWCFVTNVPDFDVDKMVPTYKCRWRMETGFRVQDEAECKTKSREMICRYFFFVYEQLLQTIWYVFYKREFSFKQFIITLHNISQEEHLFEGSKVHLNTG